MSIYDHNIAHIDRTSFNSINEAYIGKTPILEKVESKIHELRNSGLTMTNCSSTSKLVLEINRLIEKQFGMDIFALKILPTEFLDAYNLIICRRIDLQNEDFSEAVEGNLKSGYRFKKNNNYAIIVCISLGMLNDKRLSDEAIMACLLHEIGHNFGDCLDGTVRVFNKNLLKGYKSSLIFDIVMNVIATVCTVGIYLPFSIKNIKFDTDELKDMSNNYHRKVENKNKKRKIGSDRIMAFLAGKKGIRQDRKDTRNIINARTNQYYIDTIIANKDNVTDEELASYRTSARRISEVLADKFAGIYGYGVGFAELMTVFDDISGSREYKLARKIKPGHKKENDEFEKAMIDIHNYDEHPNAIQRMNSILKTLKTEYEKEDIDPKIKNELLYQIEQIQKNIDDLSDVTKKFYSIDKAQALYFNYIKNNIPDAVSADLEDRLDEELDKALEKQDKHYKH